MPRCHFLLVVIVTAIILIYKELFKNAKTGFVKLLIFYLFSKFIQCNAEVKNYFMMIKEMIYKRVLIEGKILTLKYP